MVSEPFIRRCHMILCFYGLRFSLGTKVLEALKVDACWSVSLDWVIFCGARFSVMNGHFEAAIVLVKAGTWGSHGKPAREICWRMGCTHFGHIQFQVQPKWNIQFYWSVCCHQQFCPCLESKVMTPGHVFHTQRAGARLDLRNARGKTACDLATDMQAPSDLVEALCDQKQIEIERDPIRAA